MMKKIISLLTLFIGGTSLLLSNVEVSKKQKKDIDVLCIYYPHWHVYPLGECWKGIGWTEWEYVKTAKPRYPGHNQPIVPLTGYLDGKNPKDLEKEIDLASNHGIDVFLYDWYWYNEGVLSMQESLEEGFLKAKNRDKMKFAIMWANHHRCDYFRPTYEKSGATPNLWINCRYGEKPFLQMIDYCIKHYFKQPNYYKVDGKIFFSIYLAPSFIIELGGPSKCKALLDKADKKMKEAGLPPIHWNGIDRRASIGKMLKDAGFHSSMAYNIQWECLKNWEQRANNGEYLFEYTELMQRHKEIWNDFKDNAPIMHLPVVTRGWDSTPRCPPEEPFPFKKWSYPYSPIVVNNTPDHFETLLRDAYNHVKSDPKKPFGILINAWNEYTEGMYLLPEKRYQMAYLQAIANVFGRKPANKMTVAMPYSKKVVDLPAPTFEDVPYGNHYKQRMHVWLAKTNKPAPTVIYIHGGGWTDGSRTDERLEKILPAMQKNGINVVSVEYRWIQDANKDGIYPPVKAPLEDAARAIQFVRSKAKEWNIDASRLALMGGSAGACSSLWASLSKDKANPQSADLVERESSHVKVVSVAVAQTSLDPKQMREWIPNSNYGAHAFKVKNFKTFYADREKYLPEINKYSPYAQMTKYNPTLFYVSYPTKSEVGKEQNDPTHASAFGVMFKKKCDELGIKCEVEYEAKDTKSNIDFILKNL